MIAQIIIALFGVTSIWLSQSKEYDKRKWACLIALFAQPAWFVTTYQNEQWGMFALCFLYTASWIKGFHTYWIVKDATN